MTGQQPQSSAAIEDTGLIAVLRGIAPSQAGDVVDALLAAGVTAIEFTADSPDALAVLRRETQRVGDQSVIGVGTVRDRETAQNAIEAGATFVVTPTVETEVINVCTEQSVPVIAGAFTPTEAVGAAKAGADMIKIFPASTGGPAHLRAIGGPLPELSLVPTGGVTVETAGEYIANGASAVGIGSSLVPEGVLEEERYEQIERRASNALENVQEARATDSGGTSDA
ncbi:MAG: bifunctional 4-hydroxy-2-oxoglutarate aldolase/2-dehydro-3-deoxy-phosphogluconate aldolase [Halobacteriales archaeon]